MKLGVLTVAVQNMSLEEAVKYLSAQGVQTLEIGTGGYTNKCHLDPDVYLNDDKKLQEVKDLLKAHNMTICALSCHGNAVHPDKEIAKGFHEAFEKTVLLAEKMGIDTIVTFSGCPGGSKEDKTPNWVTCPWPEDFLSVLDYQWNEVLIPYWKEAVKFANAHGVKKIAFEMHPGFCVYNPYTLLKLREAVGETIGANFDPSHLVWQGMNPVEAIKELKGAIYHFHAKDTRIDDANTDKNGVLDTRHYGDILGRSWVFRTIGYGHDYKYWKDMISTLKVCGYDGAISIEHEDSLMSQNEGLTKAVNTLKNVLITEGTAEMWWA